MEPGILGVFTLLVLAEFVDIRIYSRMEPFSQEQYDQIKDVLPVQRGNVEIENIVFLNANFYIAENGCE